MSTFKEISKQTLSGSGFHFSSSANEIFGITNFAYQDFSPNSSKVTLEHEILDDSGNVIVAPTPIATFQNGSTDQTTGAIFENNYESFQLGDSDNAVFYTTPATAGNFDANDEASVHLQRFDNSGNPIQGATTLKFGGKTGIKDLYQIDVSASSDYGHTFIVTYLTFNPASRKATIKFEKFNDSGKALASGVLEQFDDGAHHGIDFGSFYGSTNPNANGNPDLILLNRTDNGEQLNARLYDPDMNQLVSKLITDVGPDGQASTSLDKYNYLKPGTDSSDNTALLSQTFEYQDASGTTQEAIAIEKVDPTTLAVEARTEFTLVNNTQTGVGMAHLTNGDFAAAYVDGSQTFIKEFNSKMQQIGQTYALPNDNNGFDSLIGLDDGTFEIFWRELVSPSDPSKTVQHSAILTTTASHDIVAASNVAAHHKSGTL